MSLLRIAPTVTIAPPRTDDRTLRLPVGAGGADFADLAKQHSSCPSGRDGGDLGEFGPGMMVKEFDEVVFSADVGTVAPGTFLGSDAFFPFDDCVRLAAEAGVVAIAQPGGSKRDADSIAACNELGLAMLFTDQRHFRH